MAHLFSFIPVVLFYPPLLSSSSLSLCPAVTLRLFNPPLARHLAAGRANEAAGEAGGPRGEHRRAAGQAGVGQDSDEGRGPGGARRKTTRGKLSLFHSRKN